MLPRHYSEGFRIPWSLSNSPGGISLNQPIVDPRWQRMSAGVLILKTDSWPKCLFVGSAYDIGIYRGNKCSRS